jgi:hypothetical protein
LVEGHPVEEVRQYGESAHAQQFQREGAVRQGPQATITIHRTSPEDVQQRQIVVELDGERVGELMYGDSITIPVSPGRRRLRIDNTWNWKTLDLDVAPGEQLKFATQSRVGRFTWFLVGTLGVGPMYVSIEREA